MRGRTRFSHRHIAARQEDAAGVAAAAPRIGDRAVDLNHDVAVAATLAKMQKKVDLLPALEKLASIDWGFVTSHCKTAAVTLQKVKEK